MKERKNVHRSTDVSNRSYNPYHLAIDMWVYTKMSQAHVLPKVFVCFVIYQRQKTSSYILAICLYTFLFCTCTPEPSLFSRRCRINIMNTSVYRWWHIRAWSPGAFYNLSLQANLDSLLVYVSFFLWLFKWH